MGRITLGQAAAWCGGQIDPKYENITFLGANNDTRKLEEGQLFVVLKGARDGHDFVPAALEKGAAAVLCNHCDGDYPAIVVEDTRIALGKIAAQERQRIGMKVVGVTGSVGKSTTKEMIACVLESTYKVSKTPANHNNDIGMPMAVLAMPEDTQIAVLEMGLNHFREIAYLSQIGKPDVGAIINIGTMHIENLGSREGILQAKMEILEGMDKNGKLFLLGDESLLWNLRDREDMHPVYFGVENKACDLVANHVTQKDDILSFAVRDMQIELPLEGEHYVPDALAAIGIGLELGVTEENIVESLRGFQTMAGRQEIEERNGYTLIRDYYNAGPESMAAALAVLGNKSGRKIAVLGDMLELGDCAPAEHSKVGCNAAQKADLVFAYGPNSGYMVEGCVAGGMQKTAARAFMDRDSLAEELKQAVKPGDVILFKGSRGMRMELILEKFLKEEK